MSIYSIDSDLFKINKYSTCYYRIVSRAHSDHRKKLHRSDPNYSYFEQHHIVPKCMGGTDDTINLVLLTAREHFICHLLLTKMCHSSRNHQKMLFALNRLQMSGAHHLRYNSRLYQYHKPKVIEALGKLRRGIPHSNQTKEAISNALVGRPNPGTSEKLKGRKQEPEHIEARRRALIGKVRQKASYEVTTLDGSKTLVTDRREFCKQIGLRPENFSRAASTGKAVKGLVIRRIR